MSSVSVANTPATAVVPGKRKFRSPEPPAWIGWAFVAPNLIGFGIFTLLPLIILAGDRVRRVGRDLGRGQHPLGRDAELHPDDGRRGVLERGRQDPVLRGSVGAADDCRRIAGRAGPEWADPGPDRAAVDLLHPVHRELGGDLRDLDPALRSALRADQPNPAVARNRRSSAVAGLVGLGAARR